MGRRNPPEEHQLLEHHQRVDQKIITKRAPTTRTSSTSRRAPTTRTSPPLSNMPQEHPFRPYTDEINNSMRVGFNGIITGPMDHFISNSGDNIYTTMIDGFEIRSSTSR